MSSLEEPVASDATWEENTVYGPSTVIAALDHLEALVEQARAVPLSASIMLNRAEILDLLDQAREALPEDLVAADAVVADADAVLGRADSAAESTIAEANARAQSTLVDAQAQAARLVASENIVRMAQDRAREIVDQARREEKRLREGADDYVEKSLAELSGLIVELQRKTEAGRRTLAQRHGQGRTDIGLSDD